MLRTWIDGQLVAENGKTTIPRVEPKVVNKFVASRLDPLNLAVQAPAERGSEIAGHRSARRAADHESACRWRRESLAGRSIATSERDILKLVVVNRYERAQPAIAFIKNFGLRHGAMASSVAHDSHNVIAVGVDDADIAAAVNLVMEAGGGLSAACAAEKVAEVLPLPVAGLMATGTCEEVGAAYGKLDKLVKGWGSPLRAPYMTLSFMALLGDSGAQAQRPRPLRRGEV